MLYYIEHIQCRRVKLCCRRKLQLKITLVLNILKIRLNPELYLGRLYLNIDFSNIYILKPRILSDHFIITFIAIYFSCDEFNNYKLVKVCDRLYLLFDIFKLRFLSRFSSALLLSTREPQCD